MLRGNGIWRIVHVRHGCGADLERSGRGQRRRARNDLPVSNIAWRVRRSVAVARLLHPGVLDFDGWLARRGHRVPHPECEPMAA